MYNTTELMPCRLQCCVVVTVDQAWELFEKRNWNKSRRVFLPLHLFFSCLIFLYYLPLSRQGISSVLLIASVGFGFANYPSWAFHTCKMFCPFAVPRACFVLFCFTTFCYLDASCGQLHTSLSLWWSHCSHT